LAFVLPLILAENISGNLYFPQIARIFAEKYSCIRGCMKNISRRFLMILLADFRRKRFEVFVAIFTRRFSQKNIRAFVASRNYFTIL